MDRGLYAALRATRGLQRALLAEVGLGSCRYSQLGPWADYMRNIIAQLAPAAEVSGNLFNNIPLGPSYGFQDTSFVIDDALIAVSPQRAHRDAEALHKADCALCRPLGLHHRATCSQLPPLTPA